MVSHKKLGLEKYAIYILILCIMAFIWLFIMQIIMFTKANTHPKELEPYLHSKIALDAHLKPELEKKLHIAVSANFRSALERLILAYQGEHPNKGKFIISSASTGVLYAQIKQGAPYDLFFSADKVTATKLEQELKTQSAAFNYAQGVLAFWCPTGGPKNIKELSKWQGTLAIANPKLAPYGYAAEQVIQVLDWQHKDIIKGNNVAQVAQFIMTQNVQCGFLAKALIPQPLRATPSIASQVLVLPDNWYQPIEQYALKLPKAEHNELADEFIHYIQSQGQDIIKQSGYELPPVSYANL